MAFSHQMDNLACLRIQKLLNLSFYQLHIIYSKALVLVSVMLHIGEMYCLSMVRTSSDHLHDSVAGLHHRLCNSLGADLHAGIQGIVVYIFMRLLF